LGKKYKKKELQHVRLLKEYASWIYCDHCSETIGYLCYTTYDHVLFTFTCNCGQTGHLEIDFDQIPDKKKSSEALILKKNRLCCPKDESALITILKNKLVTYDYDITCCDCSTTYTKGTQLL